MVLEVGIFFFLGPLGSGKIVSAENLRIVVRKTRERWYSG